MEEFIKQIEIIEGLQVDTRSECMLMLSEVKKLKKCIKEQLKNNADIADVSNRRELFKLKEFAERQQNIPEDIQKIVNDNFWDLI